MAAEELTNVLELTETRPTRRRASRLSAEMMREMFNSDTDCSDNDPDFDIGENLPKARRSLSYRPSASKGSMQSSEDANESDECPPHKKLAKKRKRGRPSKQAKPVKTPKHTDKHSPPVVTSPLEMPGTPPTPVNNAVPIPENKATLTPENKGTVTNGSKSTELAKPLNEADERSPALATSPNVPEARAAKGLRGNPRRISAWTAHNLPPSTPPMASLQSGYTEWNECTGIIQPARAPGEESYYCCVQGCVSSGISDKEGLWLFAMPEKEQLMSTWDERLPIDYERNRPLSPRICYRHFDKADFVRRQQRLVGLKQDALPLKTERPDSPCFKKEPPS